MNRCHFSRQRRLLCAGDYRSVFARADFKVSDQHLLILARSSSYCQSRLGLIVAKKHIKRAVDRNRVKRVFRESFRTQEQPFAMAMDIIILTRRGLNNSDSAALHKLIRKQWHRLAKKLHQSGQ